MKFSTEQMWTTKKMGTGQLLDRAISVIGNVKAIHDRMEGFYVLNMNFAAVQKVWEETLKRILNYASESGLT